MGVGTALTIPRTIGGARLAEPFNDNFNTISSWANGNIGAGCLATNAVAGDNIAAGAVTADKMGVQSVTPSKLHDSAKLSLLAPLTVSANPSIAQSTWTEFGKFADFTPPVACTVLFSGNLICRCSVADTSAFYGISTAVGEPNIQRVMFKIPSAATADENTFLYKDVNAYFACAANTKYTFYVVGTHSNATARVLHYTGNISALVVPS